MNMKRKEVMALTVLVLCTGLVLSSCGRTGSNVGSTATASGETAAETEAEVEEEYYWDTHETQEMKWPGSDQYMKDVVLSDYDYPIAVDDDENPIGTVKAVFTDILSSPEGKNGDSRYIPVRTLVNNYCDEEEKTYTALFYDYVDYYNTDPVALLSDVLLTHSDCEKSDFGDIVVPGSLVQSGLLKRTVNGMEIFYVRQQYETTAEMGGQEVPMYGQKYSAYLPYTMPDGTSCCFALTVMDRFEDPEKLTDESILDLIFGTVVLPQ